MRPTGVALLDDVLGGLAPGFPLVLNGPTGSGRTVLCLQLAAASVARGEAVAMLTGEPARLLLRQASAMGLELTRALRSGSFALLELDPQVASTARVHGGSALVDAIAETAPDARLLLIDPLNALTSEVLDEVALRALVRAIFDRAAATDQGVVVTLESELVKQDPTLERVLKEACGAILEIERSEDGLRLLHVVKSRVAGCESGPVPFLIERGGACRARPQSTSAGAPSASTAATSALEAVQGARLHWRDLEVRADGRELGPSEISAPERDEAEANKPESRAPSAGSARLEPAPSVPKTSEDGLQAPVAASSERASVLIVDDCALDRTQMVDWLADRYEIATAEDGLQAMSALLAHRPDLVVLDLLMPRVDGFEVLRALHAAGSRTPVLVVSGSLARAVDRVRVLVLGASDTLAKPVQRFELRRKVEALLRAPAPPSDLDPENVEALLGATSATSVLEETEFRGRLERACRFGDEFGLSSALVGIEAPSAEALQGLVAAAEKALRAEDALLLLSKRRAVLLLVATELGFLPRILERFTPDGARARSRRGCLWHAVAAESGESGEGTKPWSELFEQLQAWPGTSRKRTARTKS